MSLVGNARVGLVGIIGTIATERPIACQNDDTRTEGVSFRRKKESYGDQTSRINIETATIYINVSFRNIEVRPQFSKIIL